MRSSQVVLRSAGGFFLVFVVEKSLPWLLMSTVRFDDDGWFVHQDTVVLLDIQSTRHGTTHLVLWQPSVEFLLKHAGGGFHNSAQFSKRSDDTAVDTTTPSIAVSLP